MPRPVGRSPAFAPFERKPCEVVRNDSSPGYENVPNRTIGMSPEVREHSGAGVRTQVQLTAVHLVEQTPSSHTEQVGHGHRHPFFGEDGMDLGLEVRPQVDELGSVPEPERQGGPVTNRTVIIVASIFAVERGHVAAAQCEEGRREELGTPCVRRLQSRTRPHVRPGRSRRTRG